MQKLRYINPRGHEIAFTDFPPYVFWDIKGLEVPELSETMSQSSGQHGYTLHNVLVDGRTVRMSAHIYGTRGERHMYELRRQINAVCNPLLGLGQLVYENDFGKWRAMAYVNSGVYERRVKNAQTLSLSFRCPGGFLESADPFQFFLAYIEGGLEFPLETPTEFGLFGYRVDILNDGDAPAPLEMHMDGGSLNPVIRNLTTGEVIRLKKQIHHYERLYINTDPENKTVQLITIDPETNQPVGVNAYGYLSEDSTLFGLVPGMNAVTFNSDDEENKAVRIRGVYRKRYVGV
jgi:hypothetical protein